MGDYDALINFRSMDSTFHPRPAVEQYCFLEVFNEKGN